MTVMRRIAKWLGWIAAGLALLLVVALGVLYVWVRASLPDYDGELALPGISAPTTIARDALGVPVISGASQTDVMRALGYAHGQDRFFQMDGTRRLAAGELSELLGGFTVAYDKILRRHRLRARAEALYERLPTDVQEQLEAYAEGVNAGLASLGARPPEYLPLLTTPVPWKPVDSLLCGYAMFFRLQDSSGSMDYAHHVLAEQAPPEVYAFLTQGHSAWAAPLTGSPPEPVPLPPAESWAFLEELRAQAVEEATEETDAVGRIGDTDTPAGLIAGLSSGGVDGLGSNNWAVAAERSATGGALLANDMHLGVGVPNTWFRASLRYPHPETGELWRLDGVTLPGLPMMIVGSNGHIAWGFTNSYIDLTDLVILEIDPEDENRYRTPDGWAGFTEYDEPIGLKDGGSEPFTVKETIWGPVTDLTTLDGEPLALAWAAHQPGALDWGLAELNQVRTIDEAIAIAQKAGVPTQNLMLADATGNIAFTYLGWVVEREGFTGSRPVSFADGQKGWRGRLEPEAYPLVKNPPDGYLWTANSLVLGDAWIDRLGDGGLDDDARAWQIRNRLAALPEATREDMLALQFDDRAYFMDRWRDVLLSVLDDEAVAADARRVELRALVEAWNGHADKESAGYRMIRGFRDTATRTLRDRLLAPLEHAAPEVSWRFLRYEEPLYRIVTEQPEALLGEEHEAWRDEVLSYVDGMFAAFDEAMPGSSHNLQALTWGQRNRLEIWHPLAQAVKPLGWLLNLPSPPMSGDNYVPYVMVGYTTTTHAASQRMVVTPGQEGDGIMQMPAGASGHFLSPYYDAGHEAWVTGAPTPLQPGEARHTLRLVPAGL